jgi:hypothetical protein
MNEGALFSVGEEVSFMSNSSIHKKNFLLFLWIKITHYPVETGNAVVTALARVPNVGFVYQLSNNQWYAKRCLRKKHKPADQSFTELLQSIKQPKGVKV